ncbi:DUF3313 domain-containing protein [Methylobacter tundripaludum]|uniref:DUF3313 domain-containing protein n=1 Tax=Methylobacter tundripaludum TaxID=173365 RepID=UPI0004DF08BC|nr:DUF3313 domain-containing protein [Methylobacter tundripaludum]
MINNINITKRTAKILAMASALLLLSACATTQKATLDRAALNCGLLGDVCGKLTPGGKDQASLRYVSPSVRWTDYNKVMIEPVTFWGGDTTSVSAADQQMLVNYFSQQLKLQLGKKFQVVDQAGPGVMKLTVAMTDAKTATPALRSISMIVPQVHLLAGLKYLATGTFPFVGGAQVEGKITDSVSGDLLAAVADKRLGGGSMATGFQWQWGDAENVIDKWCERTAERLSSWTAGTETP